MSEYRITGDIPETITRQNYRNQQIEDSSRTRISQQEQEQQKEQYNPVGDYNYNNYYPARARACAREATAAPRRFEAPTMDEVREPEGRQLPPAEIMEQIAEAYRANVNPMITKAAAGIIERALKAGMEPATVILAIEETGMASRPSPYYLSAVLRNWAQNGVVVSRARDVGVKVTDARPWWR